MEQGVPPVPPGMLPFHCQPATHAVTVSARWHPDAGMIESAAGCKAGFRLSMADAVALAPAAKHEAPLGDL